MCLLEVLGTHLMLVCRLLFISVVFLGEEAINLLLTESLLK